MPATALAARPSPLATGSGVDAFLRGFDPDTAAPHRIVLAAALRRLRYLSVGEQMSWGRYVCRTLAELSGPAHPATLHATGAYGALLCAHGHTREAVKIFTDRLTTVDDLGDQGLLLDGHRQLAEALHLDGRCTDAHRHIGHALTRWHHLPGHTGHGQAILASYAAILAGCGQTSTAISLLRRHPDLLPGDDQREQVAVLIVAEELDHPPRCTLHPARPPLNPDAVSDRVRSWWHALHTRPDRPHNTPHPAQAS